MTYTIVVPESGTYELLSRVASQSGSSGFTLSINSTDLVTQAVPGTGGWQSWQTVTSGTFNLTAGTHTFYVTAIGSGFNLNWLEFNKVG